jgi:hypothetical protein
MLKRTFFVLTLGLLLPATGFAQLCDGDCGNDGTVTVDEIVTGVNLALGAAPLSQCNPLDRNASGEVTVDELIVAINNALAGCPVPPAQSLRGVAATGSPILGRVCAVGGNGVEVGCSLTANDGSFRINTVGASGPFLLSANPTLSGQRQFSWSDVNNGVANVTPFTTLALLLASDHANLGNLYQNWGSQQSAISPSVLDDAIDAVLAHFANRLSGVVASNFDPFTSPFLANGTGFDAVLDTLRFSFDFASGTVNLNGTGLVIDFDPNPNPGGNYRLTISVAVGPAPAMQVAVINNVPKPAATGQFCVPEIFNIGLGGIGTYTINTCTFDGTTGRIVATVTVPGFSITYTATYTYTPL